MISKSGEKNELDDKNMVFLEGNAGKYNFISFILIKTLSLLFEILQIFKI